MRRQPFQLLGESRMRSNYRQLRTRLLASALRYVHVPDEIRNGLLRVPIYSNTTSSDSRLVEPIQQR